MTLGDLLEWLSIAAFTIAAYLWSGTVLALAVAAVGLFYLAQQYAQVSVRRRKTDPK